MQDVADVLDLVDGEVGLRPVDAPHLPGFFEGDDEVGADQLRGDVAGDAHARVDELAVGIVAVGVDDLERLEGLGVQDHRAGRDVVADDDEASVVRDGDARGCPAPP